ncbi:hypothetical protein, partial [Desulfovibrio sp. An276]|uniref:hypothetical protein n=1 Tax=Desulfovibrio sp. An276 TaxID=1965618 RepID=UPI0019513616
NLYQIPAAKPQKSESQSSLPIRYSLVNEPEPAAVSSDVGLYALFLVNCQELFFRFAIFFSRKNFVPSQSRESSL